MNHLLPQNLHNDIGNSSRSLVDAIEAPIAGRVTTIFPKRQHLFNTPAPIDLSMYLTETETSTNFKYLLRNHVHVNGDLEERPLLVDVTEEFLSGRMSDVDDDGVRQLLFNPPDKATHKILWYNRPYWIDIHEVNSCLNTCSYKNCKSVGHVKLIKQSSAVIFCITSLGIGKTPPLDSSERPLNQAWVFFTMESPVHLNQHIFSPSWINSFNWSMNYRLDSDIIIPYGHLTTRKTLPERNYTEIFRTKTKFAAWVVSNCHTKSLRRKFVEKMEQYGLKIDVYGHCGQNLTSDPLEMISKSYKFYLGFENSFCSDYITEKFFRYYNLNTIVVMRGGVNYKKLLPRDTYINTADFRSFNDLVKYLKYVGSNETLYTDYLKTKDRYKSFSSITRICPSFCALCRKLNNLDTNRKVYRTVPTYLDTCYSPGDIHSMDTNGYL